MIGLLTHTYTQDVTIPTYPPLHMGQEGPSNVAHYIKKHKTHVIIH